MKKAMANPVLVVDLGESASLKPAAPPPHVRACFGIFIRYIILPRPIIIEHVECITTKVTMTEHLSSWRRQQRLSPKIHKKSHSSVHKGVRWLCSMVCLHTSIGSSLHCFPQKVNYISYLECSSPIRDCQPR